MVDSYGHNIPGYDTALSQGGTQLGTGYTPVTFGSSLLTAGEHFAVTPENYDKCNFGYWENPISHTIAARTIVAFAPVTHTAVNTGSGCP
jgi:hypothetical protein